MGGDALNEAVFLAGVVNLVVALICIALSIPLIRGKVEMNAMYGVRIRKSFASAENWYKINRYGGKAMIGWTIPVIALGTGMIVASHYIPPTMPASSGWVLSLNLACLLVLGSVVQTLWWSRKLPG
jgi:uncharacterized membrane protein